MDYEEHHDGAQTDKAIFFKKIADAEIALDGVMSRMTRELVERFSANGVDMTYGWACTAMNWVCPACGRGKPEIVRLNSKGELMCRLVEHHDHMKDLVERAFKLACKSQVVLQADQQAKRFAERASPMVSAYDNTIICDDCNGADAVAKIAAGSNKSFSYSPQEIRKFVRPRANQPHEIDVDVAKGIWLVNAKTFAVRLRVIDDIARIAATDTHWYQELPIYQRAEHVYKRAEFLACINGGIHYLYQLTGKKTVVVDADLSKWRRKVQPQQTNRPTSKDLEYVVKIISTKDWERVPDYWRCPTCKRSKLETVRKSKKDWTFLLAERDFYDSSSKDKNRRAQVCAECAAVAMNIGNEASKIAGLKDDQHYARYLQLSELENIVKPQLHGRHNLSNDRIDSLMGEIVKRVRELNKMSN